MTMVDHITGAVTRALRNALRQVIGPAIGACVVAYFVYYAVQGDRGLIALKHLQGEIATAERVLDEVRSERQLMEKRASLLRTDHLDLDMLDERARSMLNLTHPNEVVLPRTPLPDAVEPHLPAPHEGITAAR
ncbi:FtsB family cell division protein [Azospirillum halopraeferens]|uniref:FtsB family cell division protein n=1 Tax=Azospirillum halopraeferens TaxID=34010 RepID=UPI0006848D74|nr:septum formation initiator family protein [Azospirillum halopraeferens]